MTEPQPCSPRTSAPRKTTAPACPSATPKSAVSVRDTPQPATAAQAAHQRHRLRFFRNRGPIEVVPYRASAERSNRPPRLVAFCRQASARTSYAAPRAIGRCGLRPVSLREQLFGECARLGRVRDGLVPLLTSRGPAGHPRQGFQILGRQPMPKLVAPTSASAEEKGVPGQLRADISDQIRLGVENGCPDQNSSHKPQVPH